MVAVDNHKVLQRILIHQKMDTYNIPSLVLDSIRLDI